MIDETETQVVVRLLVCRADEGRLGYPGMAEERHHVYLDRPLDGRLVIDYETGEPMPFYVPTYLNGRATKAPGFYTDAGEAASARELLPVGIERDHEPRSAWRVRTLGY